MCKNHKKVSFNIASEASYVCILSGQKLIKNDTIEIFKWDILDDFQTMWIYAVFKIEKILICNETFFSNFHTLWVHNQKMMQFFCSQRKTRA